MRKAKIKINLADGLPRKPRGRQSAATKTAFQKELKPFCDLIIEIASTLDFKVGSRGFCYLLEPYGLNKGDFAAAQVLISRCRKSGLLPLDICAEDEARETVGVQKLHDADVEDEAKGWIDYICDDVPNDYTPIGFWADLNVYVEIMVEKLDVLNLFEPVCAEFYVPMTNMKGWSDLNSRAAMMRRFAKHERAGRECVLLLCGDHDPAGLLISDSMRENLDALSGAVGWSPTNLLINRFGLNKPFIDKHKLTWIDNLETSTGKDPTVTKPGKELPRYLQEYIRKYGKRKCESNALVVKPDLARKLCRDTILKYVPHDAPDTYRERLVTQREQLRDAIKRRIRR